MGPFARRFIPITLVILSWPSLAQPAWSISAEPPSITLPQARALALQNNPAFKAADANWRASRGAARQAGSFENPEVEFSREDFGGDRPMDQRTPQESIALTQTVRTGGKRRAEKDAAAWASVAALSDLRRTKLDLLAEVDRQFAELLGAQERQRIAADNLGTVEEMADAVEALVQAGEVSPIESSRAQMEQDLAGIDFEAAEREVAAARFRLAQTLGQETGQVGRAEGTLAQEVVVPDEAALLGGLRSLPDMARYVAEIRRLESSLVLAKRAPLPDPTFSLGMRRYATTQERAYFAGVVIPLPLFNRNRGGVIEASARLDQGEQELRAEGLRLRAAIASTRLALEQSVIEVAACRERLLPNAERVYLAVNEGYLRGQFRLLDLLESRRSLASARLRYVDALVRLNLAKADMDRLFPTDLSPLDGATP